MRNTSLREALEVARFARRLRTIFLRRVAPAAFAAVALAGCAGPTVKLAVDPGGYHVRGDYIGSQRKVKLFVESITAHPLRQGRGAMVIADFALLNERAADARYDVRATKLEVEGRSYGAADTHFVSLRPGHLTRVSVSFKTQIPVEEVTAGTIVVEGVEPEGGEAPRFTLPFTIAD